MPLVFLCAGIAIQFLAGWWEARNSSNGPARAMTSVSAELIIGTVFMMIGVFIAAKRRGFQFGPFWGAVLKLAAISVAPSAAMTLLNLPLRFLPFGLLLNWLAGFCLYFALLGVFFELDQSDTWYCVIIIFLIKLAVALGVIFLIGR